MKTKEKLFQLLVSAFASRQSGFTAAECIGLFPVKRQVLSHYLNRLCEDGLLEKDNHRPVRFRFTGFPSAHLAGDCFSTLSGAMAGLQKAVTLCRAAMDYPPDGLAILITGESGTGKSYLASLIHQYAQQRGFIPAHQPSVILNCADYANNPELLSSTLFGHCKGAFTGADQQKEGLLDQAHQGTLFLDEIHRLSAENQEKLFLFMDKGYFYRLGDNKQRHSAKVRFIFATTENTDTVLLSTFRRRIPITVSLPAYHARTHAERIALIELFLQQEAQVLGCNIHVDSSLLLRWLNSQFDGNIGELKNTIKVLCATSWSGRQYNHTILLSDARSPSDTEIKPLVIHHAKSPLPAITQSPFPVDSDIQHSVQQFCITGDVTQYLCSLTSQIMARQHYAGNDSIFQGIFWQTVQETLSKLSDCWGFCIPENIQQAFYLSLSYTLNCQPDQKHSHLLNRLRHQSTSKAFLLAYELVNALPFSSELPAPDLMLALAIRLFTPLIEPQECIQGVIMTHGESTASSIASLINQLTGGYYFKAFNMPYPGSTQTITSLLIQHLNLLRNHAGMIILVDMGSLKEIYQEIHQHLHGDLVVINNVTTILALDIAEKIQSHHSISEIVSQIPGNYETEVRYYSGVTTQKQIILSCISGEGIAKKMQDIFRDAFAHTDVQIITLDYDVLKKQLQQKNGLINTWMIITTTEIDTGDIPSFSIRQIINDKQNCQLQHYFTEWLTPAEYIEITQNIRTLFTIEGISSRLTFLNPDIIINEAEAIVAQYQKYYQCHFESYLHMTLVMHIALMTERLMLNNGFTHRDNEPVNHRQEAFLRLQPEIFQPLLHKYRIALPVTEGLMIYEILSSVINLDTDASFCR